MRLSNCLLTISFSFLPIWLSTENANASTSPQASFCSDHFIAITSRVTRSNGQRPYLSALRSDLPEIADPIAFIENFKIRQKNWNLAHPDFRNEFPMPEFSNGIEFLTQSLKKIRKPKENRIAAENLLRDLENLRRQSFPYRKSIIKTHEGLALISLQYPSPRDIEQGLTSRIFNHEKFFLEDAEYFRDFDRLMDDEVFILTANEQTVEGLAESTLLGVRALQVAEQPIHVDRRWMNAVERLQHDVAHAMIPKVDAVTGKLMSLSWSIRLKILSDIEALPTSRKRDLARFAIYQTAHEYGNDSHIIRRLPRGVQTTEEAVQIEYREVKNQEMTVAEVQWLQAWYADTVGRWLVTPTSSKFPR